MFASGKYARAMCDRCGKEMRYKDLKLEWTGFEVCKACWDPKTKLEFPTNFPIDPEALRNPRVDVDQEATAGDGQVIIIDGNTDPAGQLNWFKGFEVEVELGDVTVEIS